MSAFVGDSGEFTNFYGTAVLSFIKNVKDLEPLQFMLQKIPNIVLVNNINYKILDIFSQTLFFITNEKCGAVDNWFAKHGGVFKSNQYLPFDVLLEEHYEVKEILKETFPQNFEISNNIRIKIRNHKVVLCFDFIKDHKEKLLNIITVLSKVYQIKRPINKYIILGYLKKPHFEFKESELTTLNSLIPKRIYINTPDIYQYSNPDNYRHFSHGMY